MDGLTFTQTNRAPSGQGARNVLPMHELPVAVAACGLCTGCEGHPGESSFLCTQRSGDPQQRAQNPRLAEGHASSQYWDNVAWDNCQGSHLLAERQAGE